MPIIAIPILFVRFWFYEAPKEMVLYFLSVNKAFFQLFSTQLLLTTLFRPIKNEYRDGLVGFSIGMGLVVKTCIIVVTVLLFFILFLLEVFSLLFFIALPFLSLFLLLV